MPWLNKRIVNSDGIFRQIVIFLIFIFIPLLVYIRVLYGDFILDDQLLIAGNPRIKHLGAVLSYFSSTIVSPMEDLVSRSYFYRPLQMVIYFINYKFGGLDVFGYHFINILIHCFNAYLVFLFINKLFTKFRLALFSGLIFALHPLNISCVSYISGTADLLSAFFILLGTLYYIDYLKNSAQKKYIVSIACCALALLSRENGLLMPVLLLLSGLTLKINKRRLLSSVFPFILLVILYLFIRFAYLDPRVYVYYEYTSSLNIIAKFLNFTYLIRNYILLLAFPTDPHMLRMVPVILKIFSVQALSVVLFMLLACLFIYYKRKNIVILFSVLWFISGFLPLWHNMFTRLTLESNRLNMAESWSYISCIGFATLLSYGLIRLSNKHVSYILALTTMLFYGGITYASQKYWLNEIGFYNYNLKFSPNNNILRNDFIVALIRHKYFRQAEVEALRQISKYPNDAFSYSLLAEVYLASGRDNKAAEQLKKVLKIDPSTLWARSALNELYSKTKNLTPVLAACDSAGLSYEDSAFCYLNKGDLAGAAGICSKALAEKPTARIYVITGVVFLKTGRLNSAMEMFKQALNIEPENPDALINLARCYRLQNKQKEAVILEEQIQRLMKK